MIGILSNFKSGFLPVINTVAENYVIAPDPIHYTWNTGEATTYPDDKVIAPIQLGVWDD